MEIRYFQIIVPIIAIFLIYIQHRSYKKGNSGLSEYLIIVLFWAGVTCLAIFPDFISDIIAKIFGIENNINALIFFAFGILIYFQFQLFKIVKKQDQLITELARKIALDNEKVR